MMDKTGDKITDKIMDKTAIGKFLPCEFLSCPNQAQTEAYCRIKYVEDNHIKRERITLARYCYLHGQVIKWWLSDPVKIERKYRKMDKNKRQTRWDV